MARGVDQAEHWRTRATQLRAAADQIADAATRATLLDLARTYDDMAARAERTARTRTTNREELANRFDSLPFRRSFKI